MTQNQTGKLESFLKHIKEEIVASKKCLTIQLIRKICQTDYDIKPNMVDVLIMLGVITENDGCAIWSDGSSIDIIIDAVVEHLNDTNTDVWISGKAEKYWVNDDIKIAIRNKHLGAEKISEMTKHTVKNVDALFNNLEFGNNGKVFLNCGKSKREIIMREDKIEIKEKKNNARTYIENHRSEVEMLILDHFIIDDSIPCDKALDVNQMLGVWGSAADNHPILKSNTRLLGAVIRTILTPVDEKSPRRYKVVAKFVPMHNDDLRRNKKKNPLISFIHIINEHFIIDESKEMTGKQILDHLVAIGKNPYGDISTRGFGKLLAKSNIPSDTSHHPMMYHLRPNNILVKTDNLLSRGKKNGYVTAHVMAKRIMENSTYGAFGTKPPGLIPKYLWMEGRLRDINIAIQRYKDAKTPVNPEWYEEHYEITEWLKNCKK